MRKKRGSTKLRKVKIIPDFIKHAEGSVLIEMGNTKVICTATVENKVPPFLKDTGKGWITAEYSMLPRSTQTRVLREAMTGKVKPRTHEIQRLIGRSLRAVVDLEALGERTVWMDCDVIQADGGTRTASITGAFVALCGALRFLKEKKKIKNIPLQDFVAAVSVGIVKGKALLDIDYEEDSAADVDMNIVMTDKGRFIEIQATAEESTFSKRDMSGLIKLAEMGIKELIDIQRRVVGKLR